MDAVHTLVGGEIQQTPAYRSTAAAGRVHKEPEKKAFSLPWARRCATSAVSYLQRRGISPDVISRCFRDGLFYEARHHGEPVCVFVGKDEAGKAKFACMRSIAGSLRKDVYGSDKEYSFCYPPRKPTQAEAKENGRVADAFNIKSPMLTAEWESMLKQVERGGVPAKDFMDGIADMIRALVREHAAPEERFAGLFPDAKENGREAVSTCPRCGGTVYEGKKGFFCDNRDCSFALWKENKFFSGKKKTITKPVAAALLKEGRVSVSGLYSEKTGKTYDAVVLLDDTGGKYVNFRLEFPAKKGRGK